MILVESLVKTFGSFRAVDGVSLEVAPGEIHGFLGPNGAGKTTTIRMIAGLLKPTAGRVSIDGHDLAREPEAAKRALGFIPDRPFLYEKLTAAEFLRFHGGLYGMEGEAVEARAARAARALRARRLEGRARRELLPRHEAAARHVRGLPAPAAGGAGGRAHGGPRPARRAAHQGDLPRDEPQRRRHPDEHAHPRGRRGDVRPHQHHPGGPHHRPRHGPRAARPRRHRRPAAHARLPEAHRRRRPTRRSSCDAGLPLAAAPGRSGARATAPGGARGATACGPRSSGASGLGAAAAIFAIVFWLTWQLLDYEELGDYLVRLGLGWLFLTFLSFVAFSALVSALSTFFLSEDLRLLLAAPVPPERLFHSRFARTVGQSAWMVVAFLLPVLLALGLARCAPPGYYLARGRHGRSLRGDPLRPRARWSPSAW